MARRRVELHQTNIKQLPQHDFASEPFFVVEGDFVEYGFAVTAPPGMEFKPNFPNCCDYHSGILAHAIQWFNRFPNCCRWHKKMAQKRWFDQQKYAGRPLKILLQVCYTTYHIHQTINAPDWYEDISEYIEYNVASFGSPGVGSAPYIAQIERLVKGGTEDFWTAEKRQRLLTFLHHQQHPDPGKPADLNSLYRTFHKWLDTIPALPAFADLKASLAGKVPVYLLLHTPQYNRYLGQTAYKTHTRSEFVALLLGLTKRLLAGVQSADLVRRGEIADVGTHHVQLLGEQHRLKQSRLVAHFTKGEDRYIKLLKSWLRNEQTYFAALLPLLPASAPALRPAGQATATDLSMTPTPPKIQKLQSILERADAFSGNSGVSAAFTAWKDFTYRTLVQLYGEASFEAEKFNKLRFAPHPKARGVPNTVDSQERKSKAFNRDFHIAVEAIKSYLDELNEDMNTSEQPQPALPLLPTTLPKRVFISHASEDAPIVEELLEILGLLGLGPAHIFCSSVSNYGIPLGENFYERLKTELSTDVLVLFVLSANFLRSPVCLCEMGATWVLTKDHVPILIPPFDFADMRGVIPATQGFKLSEKLKINELAQKLTQHFNLPNYSRNPDWERKRDRALARIEVLLAGG